MTDKSIRKSSLGPFAKSLLEDVSYNMVMVFNATFNYMSDISWRSVLLGEETGIPGENRRPIAIPDKLYHIMLYREHIARVGFELATLVVIGTDLS